jgi:glycerol-3-phosphate acyltransferase PlsY
MIIAKFVAVVILGYLIGSIPFGVLVGKLTTGRDIRKYGSGKMGATNVMRTAGHKAAAIVALLDILKGALAVIFAGLIIQNDFLIIGNVGIGMLAVDAVLLPTSADW